MATFRKAPIPSQLSDFRPSAGDPGAAMRSLADIMDGVYQTLEPAALAEMGRRGTELGGQIAAGQTATDAQAPAVGGDLVAGLVQRGIPAHAANGIVWNLQDESGLNPNAVGDNGNAFGLAQWNGPRKQALFDFAASQGKSASDPNVQLDFLVHELKTSESAAGQSVMAATDPSAAAIAFLKSFERPAAGPAAARQAAYMAGGPMGGSSPAPVVMRTADGSLTSRLMSPMGGKFAQVYNAAASVAYLSDVTVKGQADIMALSTRFPLDPQGFQQAAQGYVSDMVKNAPAAFRSDLQASLTDEAQKRFLGMVAEQQQTVQDRAMNANGALIDKWGQDYAGALATGDSTAAAKARENLGAALRVREALPGSTWTPEQSANAITTYEQQAAQQKDAATKAQASQWKDQLNTVIAAADAGGSSAYDGILNDPAVKAAQPELWAEAAAKVQFRNQTPGFMALPPDQQEQAVAQMQGQPISDKWQLDLPKAAAAMASANRAAYAKDPVKRAQEVQPIKPPSLPGFDPANPTAFVNALKARTAWAQGQVSQGYTQSFVGLSASEATTLGLAMGKTQAPEMRAFLAGAIVAGAGDQAGAIFNQIKTDDPLTKYAGSFIAAGGEMPTAVQMFRGQARIDAGTFQMPPVPTTIAAIDPGVGQALSGLNVPVDQVLAATKAIYAAMGPANGKLDETALKAALNLAVGGGIDVRGRPTGGVQVIGGQPVLLPTGVNGGDVQDAIARGFGSVGGRFALGVVSTSPGFATESFWKAAGAVSAPMLAGQPISQSLAHSLSVMPVPGGRYALTMTVKGIPVDMRDANGNLFTFDMDKLLGAK